MEAEKLSFILKLSIVALLRDLRLPFSLSVIHLGGIKTIGTPDSGDEVFVIKYCVMNCPKPGGLKQL